MTDSFVAITAGTGTNVDTRLVSGEHQQVVVARPDRTTSATVAAVAASATSVTLAASNTNRLGLTIHNDSATATLYVKLGSGAVIANSFTEKVLPGDSFYHPDTNGIVYTGLVAGIWSAASGQALVTELS